MCCTKHHSNLDKRKPRKPQTTRPEQRDPNFAQFTIGYCERAIKFSPDFFLFFRGKKSRHTKLQHPTYWLLGLTIFFMSFFTDLSIISATVRVLFYVLGSCGLCLFFCCSVSVTPMTYVNPITKFGCTWINNCNNFLWFLCTAQKNWIKCNKPLLWWL